LIQGQHRKRKNWRGTNRQRKQDYLISLKKIGEDTKTDEERERDIQQGDLKKPILFFSK
jgi:hypothetical protein